MVPTDADKRVLHVILQLTEQHQGRPPTLAEVALGQGLPAQARGNIQRQLTRLRPIYVTWSSKARSLRVTTRGLALLGLAGPDVWPAASLPPLSDEILVLLASGLTHLAERVSSGVSITPPYPEPWQRGMNRLALECVLRGVPRAPDDDFPFPSDTPTVIRWCQRPIGDWPVRFAAGMRAFDGPLLDGEEPTELCRDIAHRRDAELQACEQVMTTVMEHARQRHAPDAYVAFRRFVIDHPVLSRAELLLARFRPEFGPLGEHLGALYEPVPATVLDHDSGQVWCCGWCGWTLEPRDGRLRCADARCALLTDDFTRHPISRPWDPELLRVRRGIRRYVVSPGRYEVRTAQALEGLGLGVQLWPQYDLYDIHVSFPDGHGWAVDVKDWLSPQRLAHELVPLDQADGLPHHAAFYAVPDERVADTPAYLSILRVVTAGQEWGIPHEAVTLRDLVARAAAVVSASGAPRAPRHEGLHRGR